MKGKWAFIVNPIAGNKAGGKAAGEIRRQCKKRSISYEMVFTEKNKHASTLASEFVKKGYTHIVAVGGDGTINETARPLVCKKGIVFGIIPAGTGNDMVQITGFGSKFKAKDWDIFFKCNTAAMDTGCCNRHHFFNGMGLGFDAQVAAENYSEDEDLSVKLGHKNKYIWHILKTLVCIKARNMKTVMGKEIIESTCFMNTIAIGRRFAGGFFLTPKAYADDGLFDICNVQKVSFPKRIVAFVKVPSGKHLDMKEVNYYQTDKLELFFDEKVPYHLDGEVFYDSHFKVKVIPKSLRIIYNKEGNHFFRDAG
jgi:YegS/Rv2252/BmrU family lipid kinase